MITLETTFHFKYSIGMILGKPLFYRIHASSQRESNIPFTIKRKQFQYN